MKSPPRIRHLVRPAGIHIILLLIFASAGVASAQLTQAAPEVAPDFRFPTNHNVLPGKGPINRWEGFPHLWAQRRAEFWQRRAQDHGAVVFLGDSITQGWNDLDADFPGLKIANRGIGGDVTRGVLFRLKEDVLDLDPAAVVLLIGINDLGNGADPQDAVNNVKLIVAALERSNPHLPIVVCKVMPSKKDLALNIRKCNALLDELVRSDRHLIPCDTWSVYASDEGSCYPGVFPDMLHPNKVGYQEWAAQLRPILTGLNLGAAKTK